MIVLDTNVISEVLKPRRDPAVVTWLDRQTAQTLYITAISLSELLLGVELLPEGRRKRELGQDMHIVLDVLFGERILPFDAPCAAAYASLVSQARRRGRAIATADGQIAATAKAYGFYSLSSAGSRFL